MGNTEKVKSAGRFSARYGVGIRKRLLDIEPQQKAKNKCPTCGSNNVKRTSKGIFECRKCSAKFVGGAYIPQTLAGKIVNQMVSLKSFSQEMLSSLSKAKGDEEQPQDAQQEEAPEGEKKGEN